ncbi:MAG TPA: hypothetical protein VHF87_07905 [Methylomirabilota bacterium]|jgi:hypothetical protein|nr:hypothetical protein [Methylomirabilota bacterium]
MKQLIAAGVAVSLLVGLLLPVTPALAASIDATIDGSTASFHAFSKMPSADRDALRPMTSEELAAVEGAALGGLSLTWANLNLGIILQINICAICSNVTQGNVGGLIQMGQP